MEKVPVGAGHGAQVDREVALGSIHQVGHHAGMALFHAIRLGVEPQVRGVEPTLDQDRPVRTQENRRRLFVRAPGDLPAPVAPQAVLLGKLDGGIHLTDSERAPALQVAKRHLRPRLLLPARPDHFIGALPRMRIGGKGWVHRDGAHLLRGLHRAAQPGYLAHAQDAQLRVADYQRRAVSFDRRRQLRHHVPERNGDALPGSGHAGEIE